MNPSDLLNLKTKLPRGARKTLAEITGKSVQTIDGVLAGRFENDEVVEAAITLAEEHQLRLKSLSEKINSL